MRILTVDTSDRSIVGVVEAGATLEEIACERSADARRHAESLAPMVERATGGNRPDMIVAGTGPAAFTDAERESRTRSNLACFSALRVCATVGTLVWLGKTVTR